VKSFAAAAREYLDDLSETERLVRDLGVYVSVATSTAALGQTDEARDELAYRADTWLVRQRP